jgi:plastocyanin
MTMIRARRSALLIGMLCLVCGGPGAIALATAGKTSSRGRAQGGHACTCAKHRHCRRTLYSRKAPRGRAHCTVPKSSGPTSLPKGPSGGSPPAPTTPVAPSATPGSGNSSSGPVVAPPATESSGTAAPAHVEVTAEDSGAFRFVLSRPTVPAGTVIIEFVNHGQDEHNLYAVESLVGSLAGSIPNTIPGAHPRLMLDLRPGSYTLFCSLADHEAKGMKATLVVN